VIGLFLQLREDIVSILAILWFYFISGLQLKSDFNSFYFAGESNGKNISQ
jgi:hypothetical protein